MKLNMRLKKHTSGIHLFTLPPHPHPAQPAKYLLSLVWATAAIKFVVTLFLFYDFGKWKTLPNSS